MVVDYKPKTLVEGVAAASALTCREVVDFLDDYVAGALAPAVRTRFEEHLAVCPQCVAYLDSYAETIRLGKAAFAGDEAAAEAPAQLVDAILAARRRR